MGIKVRMSPLLARYVNSQSPVEINGDTVDECLKNLEKQFPKLRLFEKDGRLLSYLIVSVNKEVISPEELITRPVKDGDELSLMLMIGGG
jgi:sulfur carrier protein ThiS